ncbi:hypothetical protein HAX54_051946, partial [Datura stramonium]|nr:hypothetical protein [Datura stramonium]
ENEAEHEIGLVHSSTEQVSTPALNEGTVLKTDSLNIPSKTENELKNSGGTIPETVVSSVERTEEKTSPNSVPEIQNGSSQELNLRT